MSALCFKVQVDPLLACFVSCSRWIFRFVELFIGNKYVGRIRLPYLQMILFSHSYRSQISNFIEINNFFLTWSKYFDWILCLAWHILHGFSPLGRSKSWFTTILCVSMPHFVNSCTSLSVSYKERNSAMQTHTNVVCSWK